ncbi:hypothetical protein NQ317_000772 [Molorchus minor]|uniref:Uncharacterized protein n=1 Tax=Molorchus minor TaxID=1323400 RepID=A0ABQ9J0G2_9CUCU|nr:hypothetical protein NQ317_000772 [Molorchus minor]
MIQQIQIIGYRRYFVNTEYFNSSKNDVAFLFIGGESEASVSWMTYGSWLDLAPRYGALLFQLEHRYYGESQPFSDLSIENMRYLTSSQVLADVAYFISSINEEYSLSPDVKWIVFGGSYAGSLAAWARLKYPHLIHGAVSSSGPVNVTLNYFEYMQVVADDLALSGQDCIETLRTAIAQVEDLIQNPGDDNVTDIFNLCDNIEDDAENTLNLANFFGAITDIFAAIAQYNKLFSELPTTDDICTILRNEEIGTEIYRLAEVNKLESVFGSDDSDCLDYKYETRQWSYQVCTEFGTFQTTDQEDQIFGNRLTLDFYVQPCIDVYDEEFNETFISNRVLETNINYGALNINVSNVVYVYGSYDPWSKAGLTVTTNPDSPVILINGTSHCANIDLSIEKMRYLTSAQALADMAYFISLMNEEYDLSPDVKWIVFGGSYAGTCQSRGQD